MMMGMESDAKTRELIKQACANGDWLVLENCHLALSSLRNLAETFEEMDEFIKMPSFRLWLTTMNSTSFPQTIV